MAKGIFGNFFDRFKLANPNEKESMSNQIATDNVDGAIEVNPDSMSQYMMNLDWSYDNQAQLIETYRKTANNTIVDYAIDDIINEMVSFSEDEAPIELDLSSIDKTELSDKMKDEVYASFEKIAQLLELKKTIHRRTKQFYIDGRLAYQKVVNPKKMTEGLINVIELDTRYITKYTKIKYDQDNQVITGKEDSYIYSENIASDEEHQRTKQSNKNSQYKQAFQLNPETVAYVTSGLRDPKTGYAISWLHKAVKPANQLNMMENALVVYRIVRAPERRIFYVDTANLPKNKAEQYLRSLKNNYRNRMSFNPDTGMFKDDRHLQTMQEDFWLPRNSSGRGTEVTTLPGGSNLSDIDDILYFQKQLYKALNIPISRLEPDSVISLGRASEISRDELKFSRFVSSVRKRFNVMLMDLLKTELILTKKITAKEWYTISNKIDFRYALDQYLEESKESEMIRDRLDLLQQYQPYVGKYVSNEFIRKNILHQTEPEIEEIDKQIDQENQDPKYQEPEQQF